MKASSLSAATLNEALVSLREQDKDCATMILIVSSRFYFIASRLLAEYAKLRTTPENAESSIPWMIMSTEVNLAWFNQWMVVGRMHCIFNKGAPIEELSEIHRAT